ncbi:MAG: hypothetical protein E6Q24_13350 [Chitinophagaceae bacterium]|jgi:O-antigen/teichoic acid export membrane protein|nr:MAG: hypothetical protein E6Q24_13350 [Chitinophagaceae bacterium]
MPGEKGHRMEMIKGVMTILIISAMQPLVNFLLLPVYTSFLDSSSYGYLSILNNISLFFSIISGLNIANAVAAYYKSYKTPDSLNLFIGNAISFCLVFNTVLLLVLCLFGNVFAGILFKEQVRFFPDIFLAIAIGLYSNLFILYGYYLRYDKQISRFAIFSIIQLILLVGLQLFSLYFTRQGVTGLLLMRMISAGIMVMAILIVHRKYCFRRILFKENLKKPLKYSLLTGPALLVLWLTTYGDRFILEHLLDLKSVGKYSFLITICSVADLIVSTLNAAFQPYIFDRFLSNKEHVKNFYTAFIVLCVAGFSALIILCSNIDLFVKNDEFLDTLPFTIPMVASFVFNAVTNLYAMQITYAQKGRYYLLLSCFVLVANLSLNLLLIPGMGIKGAITANILTKLVMASLFLYLSQKAFFTNTIRQTGMVVLLFLLTSFASWSAAVSQVVSYKAAALLQFFILIILIGAIYRKTIMSFLNAPKQIV